ncbi:MAG: 3-oxoacyl-ACP synthase III [Thermoguttaceae bacterium]|nr:3-oxoacyl-ACP synthase III [Thermoguttaceae bacterium]
MRYQNVFVEGIVCALPDEIVTTDELEKRLAPLYERLRLPYGRLELMTGIRERRVWPKGELPGDRSVRTVDKLFEETGADRANVGALIHASVCRDYQEPATACDVHRRLGLPARCVVHDISNACLGLLSGILLTANLIELGQIDSAVVVGTETSRALMESTIDLLRTDLSITRQSVKPAFASLTIGSGSAAVLLTNGRLTRTGNRLLGGVVLSDSRHAALCRSQVDVTAGGNASGQLMQTDSEALLHAGVGAAARAFELFKKETGWTPASIDRTFCHQVGVAHEKLLFNTLELDPAKNFRTFSYLGNTGSVALPTAAALGIESGFVREGEKAALLGIGSGINVIMLAVEWNKTLRAGV